MIDVRKKIRQLYNFYAVKFLALQFPIAVLAAVRAAVKNLNGFEMMPCSEVFYENL